MKKLLPWERCAKSVVGNCIIGLPTHFSRTDATYLTKRLIREVTVISAEFHNEELVVFSPLLSVARTVKEGIEFYGLYESGDEETDHDTPNLCVRRSIWTRTSGDLTKVLSTLECNTVFFHASHGDLEDIIASDFQTGFGAKIIADVHLNSDRTYAGAEYSFYSIGDIGRVDGDFHPEEAAESYVRSLFEALKKTYGRFAEVREIKPSSSRIDISYSSLELDEIIKFAFESNRAH